MADYVFNEALCALYNNFDKIPRMTIVSSFSEFYTDDEICVAKKIILDIANSLSPKPDELKHIKARVGDGKIRRDAEDMLQIFSILDAKKVKLPRFFAADTSRIPTFKDIEINKLSADFSTLATRIDGLVSTGLSSIAAKLDAVNSSLASINEANSSSAAADQATALVKLVSLIESRDSAASSSCPPPADTLWSTIVKGRPVAGDNVGNRSPTKPAIQPIRRSITGTASGPASSSKLTSSSSGPKLCHVFVGRVHKDATEADIISQLEANGVKAEEVRKLKATQPWQEKSSAFRVSVSVKFKDVIMSAAIWSDNIEVRDWFFKPKSNV